MKNELADKSTTTKAAIALCKFRFNILFVSRIVYQE